MTTPIGIKPKSSEREREREREIEREKEKIMPSIMATSLRLRTHSARTKIMPQNTQSYEVNNSCKLQLRSLNSMYIPA